MQPLVYVYKPRCLTPLQTIKQFTKQLPEYAGQKIGYAGRLDPMAEGILILLIGKENKKRHKYEHLPKTYRFDMLLGFETDTYDILGMVTTYTDRLADSVGKEVKEQIAQLPGVQQQAYPPYSSQPVNGKPLFWWARNSLLETIIIPQKSITITYAGIKTTTIISLKELQTIITSDLLKVTGNFRQKEILSRWKEVFSKIHARTYPLIRCEITCSSGTYIRSLIHEIGHNVGYGAIALRIIRTQVGNVSLKKDHIVRILS